MGRGSKPERSVAGRFEMVHSSIQTIFELHNAAAALDFWQAVP
jgi:hypothetical protein